MPNSPVANTIANETAYGKAITAPTRQFPRGRNSSRRYLSN
jgi:hypothetical protein